MDLTLDTEFVRAKLIEVTEENSQLKRRIAELETKTLRLEAACKAYEQGARYIRDAVRVFGDDVMQETILG